MKSKAILILAPGKVSDFDKFKKNSWDVNRMPPLGLMSLASYAKQKGHNIKIIDCREIIVKHRTNNYIPIILDIAEKFSPDVVGISVLTASFEESKKISFEFKKRLPSIPIVAGGPHPSVEPALTFQQIPYIDLIFLGEAEDAFLDFLEGKNSAEIPGLICRNNIDNFKKRIVNLDIDRYPFPDYDIVNHKYYAGFSADTTISWGFRSLALLTSRSCSYSCNFCATSWSKPFRYHSLDYVVEMTKNILKYKIDVISFFDDTIMNFKDRLHKICSEFIRLKLFWPHTSFRWFANARADQIDPKSLSLMKRAGCFGIGIGIESGSDRILNLINKRTTVGINKRACNYVKEAGLFLHTSFIIGFPGETESEMRETLDFMKKCDAIGVGIFRPLPGSPFYRRFVDNKILSKENIDWSDLGNFSIPSKYSFHNVSEKRFKEIWNEALEIIRVRRWTAVHKDALIKYPREIKNIASRTRVKIVEPNKYESSDHFSYIPFSFYSFFNVLPSILYNFIPFKLRIKIRAAFTGLKKICKL